MKKEASREEIEKAKKIMRRFQGNGRFRVKRRRLYIYNDSWGTSYSVFIKDIAEEVIKEWEIYINKDIFERTCEFTWVMGNIAEKQQDRDEKNKLANKIKRCRAAMKEAKWRKQKEKYERLEQQYDELWNMVDIGQVGVLAEDAWHEKHDRYYF